MGSTCSHLQSPGFQLNATQLQNNVFNGEVAVRSLQGSADPSTLSNSFVGHANHSSLLCFAGGVNEIESSRISTLQLDPSVRHLAAASSEAFDWDQHDDLNFETIAQLDDLADSLKKESSIEKIKDGLKALDIDATSEQVQASLDRLFASLNNRRALRGFDSTAMAAPAFPNDQHPESYDVESSFNNSLIIEGQFEMGVLFNTEVIDSSALLMVAVNSEILSSHHVGLLIANGAEVFDTETTGALASGSDQLAVEGLNYIGSSQLTEAAAPGSVKSYNNAAKGIGIALEPGSEVFDNRATNGTLQVVDNNQDIVAPTYVYNTEAQEISVLNAGGELFVDLGDRCADTTVNVENYATTPQLVTEEMGCDVVLTDPSPTAAPSQSSAPTTVASSAPSSEPTPQATDAPTGAATDKKNPPVGGESSAAGRATTSNVLLTAGATLLLLGAGRA